MADDRFAHDTALRPLGDGSFEARIDRGWWIVRGPNGGYVAAIVLRAMQAALADPARRPRSLTVHYAAPLEEGAARLETSVERRGRSLATCTARVVVSSASFRFSSDVTPSSSVKIGRAHV